MRDSIRIGSVFGIEIRLHVLFLVIVLGFPVNTWYSDGLRAGLDLLARFCLVFSCVLVHELGHSVVAIRHGVRVRDILLWPLGGVARLERLPDSPRAELLIAVAGPLVNFTILAILTPILLFREAPFPSQAMIDGAPTLFEWFVLINIAMGTFNLIPAFPLDGGRVLRALLSPRFGIVKATCAAVVTGRLLAVVAVVAALSDIELVSLGLLGAFVWIFGGLELRATMLRTHATAWGARELSTGDIAVPIWKNVAP